MRAWWLLVLALLAAPSWAAHAYAQFGDIKYPAGFTHFDYVNPDAPKGGEIRMVPPTRPTNFDKFNPFTLKGTAPAGLGNLMFESLLVGNSQEATTAYGLLAEDVEVAPDRLSTTFRLNPKARFNDGTPVLAADVVHSFNTLMSKEAAPQFRTIYAEVKKAVALGERTVRFDFATPNPELPLVVGGMPVFGRAWGAGKPFDQVITELPVASGPYKLPSPRLGRDITYVRDPNYWGAELPTRKGQFNFDRISFKIYLDDTARFEGLKAGEYDFAREFSSRNWARQYTGKAFTSGAVVQRGFPNGNPSDYQGWVFNLRKDKFKDVRVRQAIGLAFDFEWLNKQMFYGLYKRVQGWFPNSEFHAAGLPGPDELALMEPLRDKLQPEVFGAAVVSPTTTPPHSLRENLRQAQKLLAEAGWTYRDGALRDAKSEAFTIEALIDQPSLLRVLAPMQGALRKLGIEMSFRTVDFSLAQQRMDNFDFEMTTIRLPGSNAPGSELIERFGSQAARTTGSSNVWGIENPAVDAVLSKVVSARTRPELVTAMRVLDRILSHGHYGVPQYYGDEFLIGYRPAPFVLPKTIPPYIDPGNWAMSTWWASPTNK
ncbi:extracellular solute-binding protein [Variovorax soli]|uniref:extracellular solute-binding protein n=1 Tax=Variovorax soli TaxID=376815 RepID=UPI0008398243|nr:extracellular solute-binding protein [Variovorax soli]